MSVDEDQTGPGILVSKETGIPRAAVPVPLRNRKPFRNRKETGTRKESAVRRALSHPVRSVPLAFLCVIVIGAGLLMLPVSRTGSEPEVFMPALFASVSAVCVTGLITVDTATFWTPFGQGVILGLIQAGGFGIMTLATLLALLVRKNIGLRGQLVAQSESHTVE
ncbi:hypothetical protein ACIP9X_08045 [Arthrobacter sp. NPDC093125]|uniref:hypothetical protein n=1 Tax=Arthrobacter sp. NPDC093125 TaxID=3363944 RepID=UPI0038192F8A